MISPPRAMSRLGRQRVPGSANRCGRCDLQFLAGCARIVCGSNRCSAVTDRRYKDKLAHYQESSSLLTFRAGPASNRTTRAGGYQNATPVVVSNSREFRRFNMRHKHVLVFAGLAALTLVFSRSTLAEYRTEKNLKLEPGGRFAIDSSAGSITITGTSESGARIVVTSNRDDLESLFDLQFEESAGEVRVTAHKKHMFGWPNHLRLHFDVRVPADTQVDVKTGGGSVEVSQLKRDADLNTSGGSIKVSDLAANLKAHTSGGSIELKRVTGDARIDTSGGGIEGNSLGGSIEARTSGGSVEFDEVKGDLLA